MAPRRNPWLELKRCSTGLVDSVSENGSRSLRPAVRSATAAMCASARSNWSFSSDLLAK
jgi:hypothetical protein